MKKISSPHNPRLRSAIRLKTSRGRKTQRRIIIFGVREIRRAVESGIWPLEVFLSSDLIDQPDLDWASSHLEKSEVYDLPVELFGKLRYGERQDGMVAIAQRPELELRDIGLPKVPLVLVLESIEKPGNIGSVLRGADGAGANAVVMANPQCDPLHPNSIRSSLGTAFAVPLAIATNEQASQWIDANNLQLIIGTDSATTSYLSVDFCKPTAIVLGNESDGLSSFWLSHSSARAVSVPMNGHADSLNLSVASAIFCYEALRQRATAPPKQIEN